MNPMHPSDALVLANSRLDALRASARAQEEARAAVCRSPDDGAPTRVRLWRRNLRGVRPVTPEGSAERCCPCF